ncbi:MAG: sterol desaturase family protein [Bacteroidia bacterium]|nr:sterol desaturase family protein [Bacteroidia bacterium]
MRSYHIKNKGTTSLFSNRFLEALTRTHFAIPVTLYFILAILLVSYATLKPGLQLWRLIYYFPLGLLVFSLVEYSIHRWLFHFHASTERQKILKYKIHGVHHEFPKDKDRLVMPPVLSILIALLFYGFFSVIFEEEVLLFFPGFLSGYSTYLLIHYAVHRFRPPANFFRILWTHHALHHYKSEDSAFGVSMPVWDHLFKTMPPVQDGSRRHAKEQMEKLL